MSERKHHYHISVIHQTDLQSAEKIISTQQMIPSAQGMYGPGIYFANTIEATNLKAHRKGVYLIADVYPGKAKTVSKDEVVQKKFNYQQVMAEGYTSIYGYKMPTGREIVVFDPNRVKNIKYIFGNVRPQSVFTTDRERITLFFVTDKDTAANIGNKQLIPKTDGPLGKGYYMYDTVTDAIQANPTKTNAETYLAADVFMVNYYKLNNGQKVDDPNISKYYKTFMGVVNGMAQFVLKDPKLIKRIHFCGGKPWNK